MCNVTSRNLITYYKTFLETFFSLKSDFILLMKIKDRILFKKKLSCTKVYIARTKKNPSDCYIKWKSLKYKKNLF